MTNDTGSDGQNEQTGALRYFQRPKPYSAELGMTLTEHRLMADRGKSKQEAPLSDIAMIRLRFTPKNSVFHAFTCDVRTKEGRPFKFQNVSFKSLVETEKLDEMYSQFIRALIVRAAKANPDIVLHAGLTPFRYWMMVILGVVMLGGLLGSALYAMGKGNTFIALLALGLVGYLVYWMKEYATRNRPRRFQSSDIPPDVLPR